jgi:toxin ParE1/3/4
MRLRFSRLAETDIEDIGDFIARDNPQRAVTFIQNLRMRCRHLAVLPGSAPSRDDLGEGVRMSVFGRYLILYVLSGEKTLEIRRIVHGARNLTELDLL